MSAKPPKAAWRRAVVGLPAILVLLLLSACHPHPRKPIPVDAAVQRPAAEDFSGDLYAPEIADSGPRHAPDLSDLVEPVPKDEPRSRYGNHSPYTVLGRTYRVLDSSHGYVERGIASWYGSKFHGRPTSSFEPYDMYAFTAAHKTLPLPTYARVTNLENGRSVVLRVNDRGPFVGDRLLDLSYAAAMRLDVVRHGTAMVEVRALDPDDPDIEEHDAETSVVATPAPGRVWLQLGSFSSQNNARRLVEQLRRKLGLEARIEPADVAGKHVYRVRAGPWKAAEPAVKAAERAHDAGFDQGHLITE